MNMLNSTIIEGTIQSKKSVNGELRLNVRSERYVVLENEKKTIYTNVPTIVTGRMAEVFNDKTSKNRGIRVVGRLEERNSKICLFAEHIELKPDFN